MYRYIYIYIYTCVYIYIYIYIHIYVVQQPNNLSPPPIPHNQTKQTN